MPNCMVHKFSKNLNIWSISKLGCRYLSWIQGLRTRPASIKMARQYNIRWAFNTKLWKPREEQILDASSYIQTEEKERISRFCFQEDAKSSLIGRLMLRKFAHLSTLIPYDNLCLGRDKYGKPILLGTGESPISFNISHQGDYVVLAGNSEVKVGVDTMKIEPPVNKDIKEFFRIMRRQFSSQEWETIYKFQTELEQIACFYRIWCLKESYVKNTGFGLSTPLQDLNFSLKTLNLTVGEYVRDTELFEKGVLKDNWKFEETLLDDKHAVAVSLHINKDLEQEPVPFSFLSFEELVKEAKPLNQPDFVFRDEFMKKQFKSFETI